MAEMEYVKKIDNLVKLQTVLVSCSNKEGIVSNRRKDKSIIHGLPEKGILGAILNKNPEALLISTGGTYKTIKEAGLPVMEISQYTQYPEMKTGLVKSLHPAIHAGLLAHKHTVSDDIFMRERGLRYIDALIVNFYPLDEKIKENGENFEVLRQFIDVGGPTMTHNARKAFVSTAVVTNPEDYKALADELEKNNGAVSITFRLELAKKASKMLTEYMLSVDKLIQRTTIEQIKKCYDV
jgi:phosphoribosylaminoimidazolecarboxamide formyltransferase/IMP cyclohydrolase